MATKLELVKSNLYTANPTSRYLTLDDDELLRELYSKDKLKDQYESFQSFKKDYSIDDNLSQTELQKKVTPFNYSTSQKIVESFEPAFQTLFGLVPDSVKKNVAVAPIANVRGLSDLALDVGLRKYIPESVRKGAADFSTAATQLVVGKENVDRYEDESGVKIGKTKRPETISGTLVKEGTEFGLGLVTGQSIINFFKKANEARKIKKLQTAYPDARISSLLPGNYIRTKQVAEGIALGEAVSQVTLDPQTAFLGEWLGGFTSNDEGTMSTLLEYVSSGKDKTDLENRAALLFDGLFISAGITGAIQFGPTIYRSGKELFNKFKSVKETGTPAEKQELIKVIQVSAENKPLVNKTPSELRGPETDEVVDLWRFSENPMQRGLSTLYGAFFRSEGTKTPKMFKVLNLNKNAQVAWAAKGEQLMNRINSQIETLAVQRGSKFSNNEELRERLSQDLFDGYLFGNKPLTDLPKSMQSVAKEARDSIDELSELIGQSKGVDPELKKAIRENLGGYLRTTYKRFEDPNYKPSQQHLDDATAYIHRQFLKQSEIPGNANFGLSSDVLKKQAQASVDILLREAKYSDDMFQFLNTVKGGKDASIIFKEKLKIHKSIENLLGKETNTGNRVFSTINTLSDFIAKQNTFEKFYRMGEGKYFFKNATGQFNRQIKGKEFGSLDGQWTTDSMYVNFLRPGKVMDKGFDEAGLSLIPSAVKLMYAAKGFGQGSKTVLNNVTHERNFQSSAIIMLSNGLNPFSKTSWEATEIAWNNVIKGGEEALDNLYNRYLRLGIVNQNAKIGDIRQLLQSASKTGAAGYANKVLDFSVGGKSLRGTYKGIERLYVAEDDIWKIAVFEKELATLKKAFPNRSADALEQQAAQITRDIMPTYDMIPEGFKALRYFPWGNYFSFHAERFRNTVKTYKQGWKEVKYGYESGNKIIRNRGLQRLGAKVVVGSRGGYITSAGAMTFAGVSSDEDEHIKNIMKKDYHGDNWIYDTQSSTGDLLFVDTKFIDPDAPVNDASLDLILKMVATGNVAEEELDSVLNKFFVNSLLSVSAPFFDENLLGSVLIDTLARGGKDVDGFDIPGYVNSKNPSLDIRLGNAAATVKHAWNTALKPAVIDNVQSIVRAVDPKEDKYGVKPSLELEAWRNVVGFNYKPITEKTLLKSFKQQLYDFDSEKRVAKSVMTSNYGSSKTPITVDDLYNNFLRANKIYYTQYVETKQMVDSLRQLAMIDRKKIDSGQSPRYNIGTITSDGTIAYDKIESVLKDAGFTEILRNQLNNGNYARDTFIPIVPTTIELEEFFRMHPDADKTVINETLADLTSLLTQLPLLETRDKYTVKGREALEMLKRGRVPKVTGGLINSPFLVPYTGEPYQREQKSFGGILVQQLGKQAAAKGVKEIIPTPLNPKEIPLLPLKYTQKRILADDDFVGIPAHHGTAYDFEKFTTDFLKSGEGAMGYGKGLYFAENLDIAKMYKETVSLQVTRRELQKEYDDLIVNAEQVYKSGKTASEAARLEKTYLDQAAAKLKQLKELGDGKPKKASLPIKQGKLYDVNLKTTKTHLLDWDMKMSSQSSGVINAAEIALDRLTPTELELFINKFSRYPSFTKVDKAGRMDYDQLRSDARVALEELTGGDFISGMNRIFNIEKFTSPTATKPINTKKVYVEDLLKEEGVQGIKFLDGLSRKPGGKKGRNYVIFDARIIEISKKYGISIPAAGKMLMEMDDEDKSQLKRGYTTGGLVEGEDPVPYTKEDPADRVNPYTGEPYQEQMNILGFKK
jgi:hypothetical protein